MRAKREALLWSRINRRLRSRYTMIDVEPVQGMFNHRCHENAVQWAKSRPDYGVAEVIYIDDGKPILHYINTKNGRYFETTLGWRAEYLEYYKIRDIHKTDYHQIHSEFERSLADWLIEFTNWFDRKVLKISRVL